MPPPIPTPNRMILRSPLPHDGPRLYKLFHSVAPKDCNTELTYALLCEHFRDSVVLAQRHDGVLLAALTAYVKPIDPTVLYLWQIAIDAELEAGHLAEMMLTNLLTRPLMAQISGVEAIITDTNEAVFDRLLHALADEHGSTLHEAAYAPNEDAPVHPERLLRCDVSTRQPTDPITAILR